MTAGPFFPWSACMCDPLHMTVLVLFGGCSSQTWLAAAAGSCSCCATQKNCYPKRFYGVKRLRGPSELSECNCCSCCSFVEGEGRVSTTIAPSSSAVAQPSSCVSNPRAKPYTFWTSKSAPKQNPASVAAFALPLCLLAAVRGSSTPQLQTTDSWCLFLPQGYPWAASGTSGIGHPNCQDWQPATPQHQTHTLVPVALQKGRMTL